MNSARTAIAVGMMLALAAGAAADCKYSDDREVTESVAGASLVVLDVGAGFLKVEGRDDASEIQASGVACSSKESLLDDIRLVVRRSGDRVLIKTEFPKNRWGTSNMRLDLTVSLPSSLHVRIEDGSGAIRVANVASVEIDDGSGEIVVVDTGDVEIEDGSGSIEVRHTTGNARIDDGSGNIRVEKANGDVVIGSDGSGNIAILGVGGTVRVGSDGSGNIRVEDVQGDFIVRSDGSGSINYSGVAGRVDIPDD
ncbi:MAG: hypothetical protein GY906_11155 [bacterium]|nr:hypothetical protein [bacterium]